MSKYINADKLKAFIDAGKYRNPCEKVFSENDIIDMVNEMPSADVVEVVRCKDCKYNYGIANNCEYAKDDIVCCYWESDGLHSDDFCSKGERKDG